MTPIGEPAPGPTIIEREVAASSQEFERDLRKAWPSGVERLATGRLRLVYGDLQLDVGMVMKGTRRLGLLALPRLEVTYRFEGGDEAARRRFLAMLDRAMQRGGG